MPSISTPPFNVPTFSASFFGAGNSPNHSECSTSNHFWALFVSFQYPYHLHSDYLVSSVSIRSLGIPRGSVSSISVPSVSILSLSLPNASLPSISIPNMSNPFGGSPTTGGGSSLASASTECSISSNPDVLGGCLCRSCPVLIVLPVRWRIGWLFEHIGSHREGHFSPVVLGVKGLVQNLFWGRIDVRLGDDGILCSWS